jgi:hypothetical protein
VNGDQKLGIIICTIICATLVVCSYLAYLGATTAVR